MRRFTGAELDAIDTDAAKAVRAWFLAGDWKHGKNLILAGPTGTGKTHLAWAGLNWFKAAHVRAGERMEAVAVPELLERMRPPADFSVADTYLRATFLLLDDLGAERASDWAKERIYVIINSRYNDLRPTIITTNGTIDQLTVHVGDRIVSRLIDGATVVEVTGSDRRRPAEVSR